MTASGRRVQLDRRRARWRSCFANRRCTTPTRETVASQRIGTWPRTTPICTSGNRPLLRYMHPAAASTSIPRRCACKLGTISCAHSRAMKETSAPTATRGLSHGPRTSTALLILDGRHNSHGDATNLALVRGTTPLSLLSCCCKSVAGGNYYFELVFACLLGHTRHISKRLQHNLRSAGLQLLHMRQWMSCNNEELRSLPCYWSRPQHLCEPRSGLEQPGVANIAITNFSRSSGHETASSNSERARGLRRLLQQMFEVQSIICRAGSRRYEAASKKRIGTKSLRNASDWMQWRKAPWSRLMHALPKRYMFCKKILLVM